MGQIETRLDLWERMHNDPDARKCLDGRVRQAWERSDSYGVDYRHAMPYQVPQEEWKEIKRRTKKLFIYASSIIRPLWTQSGNKELGAILFSNDGTILQLYGDSKFRQWAEGCGVRAGTRWSEESIGANVFSLGQRHIRWVELAGEENYSFALTAGAFYFAPIKLENGDFYGGLAVALQAEKRYNYLLALAVSIARAIELQIFWFNNIDIYSNISEGSGMLCVDQTTGRNNILVFGKEIFKMLGVQDRDAYYGSVEEIIDPLPENKKFWEILNNKMVVTDKNVQIMARGRQTVLSISTTTFKEKKFNMDGMIVSVNSIGRINKLVSQYSGNNAHYRFEDIIGQSDTIADTIKRGKRAALSDTNILLQGESGVGKDVFAQAIHNGSKRYEKPFVAINCAAFSKELIASELFGYESGAFTGAKKEGAIGKFELADGGTLFLDEIGDMPLDLQAVLLRVLEERSFRKVGGNRMIQVNVRIIAATNKNLGEKISQGLFREDLFYRLGIIRINIAPLRDRSDDVLLLASHFIAQICSRFEKPPIRLAADAITFLREYTWPGNIRELRNLLEGIIGVYDEAEIGAAQIRQYLGDYRSYSSADPFPNIQNQASDERSEIMQALRTFRNNKSKTAAHLGISRNTLYKRMREYGLV